MSEYSVSTLSVLFVVECVFHEYLNSIVLHLFLYLSIRLMNWPEPPPNTPLASTCPPPPPALVEQQYVEWLMHREQSVTRPIQLFYLLVELLNNIMLIGGIEELQHWSIWGILLKNLGTNHNQTVIVPYILFLRSWFWLFAPICWEGGRHLRMVLSFDDIRLSGVVHQEMVGTLKPYLL